MTNYEIIATIIVAIVAASPGLLALRGQSKKIAVDAVKIRAELEAALLVRVKSEIDELWAENDLLRNRIATLEKDNTELQKSLRVLQVENVILKNELHELRKSNILLRAENERLNKENGKE